MSGDRHYGLRVNLSKQSDASLIKSIKSYRRTIDEHAAKINRPEGFIDGWERRSYSYKLGIIRKWGKDIIRNDEQLAIALSIADERGLDYERLHD